MAYVPPNSNGSATSANSAPVVIASDQATVPVSLASVPSHAVTNAGTFATQAAQSGTWTVQPGNTANTTAWKVDGSAVTQPISGTVTVNAGTNLNTSALALDATLTGGTQVAIAKGAAASGASKSGNPVQTGGVFNTTQPTVTTGQVVEAQSTARGATIVAPGVDNFAVQATLAAETTKVIGTVNQGTSPWVTSNAITSVVGNGTAATSQRVTLASDSTGQVTLATGSNTIGALTANQSVNNAQINGVTPLMGNGTSGTGAQRVTIASDSTGQVALAAGSALVGKVGIDQTTPGTTNAVVDTPVTSGGLSIVTGSVGATATAIKASAGQLYGYHLFNTTAAVAYVQIFNVASGSVTLGTTAPTLSIGIPASGGVTVNFDKGIAFGTAISFGCTTTRTGSTGATCDVNFYYK